MTRNKWQILQPGDIVDVIAPSSWCSRQEFKQGMEYLASLDLQLRTPKNIFKPDFIYANSIEETLEHLRQAFYSPDSKAIWCARGGAGTFRFLSHLRKWKVPKKTKMFIGLSDITTFHLFLNQQWNWPTLHGPMISMLGYKKSSSTERRDLERVIFGDVTTQVFSKLKPMNRFANQKKVLKGPLLGGNLCLFQNAMGTPWEPSGRGKILFFEDIDERGYEVERMLMHLENVGIFKNVQAVVLGEFIGGAEKTGKNLVHVALQRFANRMKFPVLKGIKSGHGPLVRTLPLNTPAQLETGREGILIVHTGAE